MSKKGFLALNRKSFLNGLGFIAKSLFDKVKEFIKKERIVLLCSKTTKFLKPNSVEDL